MIFDPDWFRWTIMVGPPLLFSLTLHEYAHARTALAFGDPTAKENGRVTFNPLAHLDPVGTIVLLVTHFIGWARPVPVNPMNLQPRRLGDIAVSLAGPVSNLGLAIMAAGILRVLSIFIDLSSGSSAFGDTVVQLLAITIVANLGLFIFNLIPLFPLDGHHVLRELLPARMQEGFMSWQMRYGRLALMAMIFLPMFLPRITGRNIPSPLWFLIKYLMQLVLKLVGLT